VTFFRDSAPAVPQDGGRVSSSPRCRPTIAWARRARQGTTRRKPR